jgi:PAS domain S-box-containing protein
MVLSQNLGVGLVLVLVGIGLLGIIPLALRRLPRRSGKVVSEDMQPVVDPNLPVNESATLLVMRGGRVVYLNPLAREWFGLSVNENPNLERMARRIRPADAFFSLCAGEGQTRFNLDHNLVEGVSYAVPYQESAAVLVTLKRPHLGGTEEGQDTLSSFAVTIFNEISQAMSASLELETTIETILESIEKLIPSDFSEINLFNTETIDFTPYRYLTEEDGIRRLNLVAVNYTLDKGYTGYLSSRSEALLVRDVVEFQDARPAVSRGQFPIRSYLGIPLRIGGMLIGTIELASQSVDAFTDQDREVLDLLSGHAAVALQNAFIHNKEKLRIREMAGLAELAQVSRSASSAQVLYGQILETISPLVEAEILGFLIYDEQTRSLEGQIPFHGLPEPFIELYRTTIEPESPGERVWLEGDVIITDDMGPDSLMGALGLSPLAQASAMRETVLVPLTSAGRSLGYLQAANKLDGARFNEDDLRLMRIIAGQVSPILENANLIHQARRRAQRAEALRRIASLAGSEATVDESLQFSLLELSRFLQADMAAIFLLDNTLGTLQLHERSAVGIAPEKIGQISLHLATQANIRNTVTETLQPLFSEDMPEEAELPLPYRALQPMLPNIHSLMVVPMVVRGRGVGEVLVGSEHRGQFDQNDYQTLETAASQVAISVERASMADQTDETLQRRADEMGAIHRLARQFAVTDNVENLLRVIHNEAMRISGADSGGIMVFQYEFTNSTPVIIQERVGITPPTITALDIHAATHKETMIVNNFANHAFSPDVDGMASGMFLPITKFGHVVGVLRLFSRRKDHFDTTIQDLIQALTSQAGVALSNIWDYQQAIRRTSLLSDQAEALNHLLLTRKQLSPDLPLDKALDLLADAIQQISQFEVVLIYRYDRQYRMLEPAAMQGFSKSDAEVVSEISHPWENIQQLILPEYQRSRSYLVPHDQSQAQFSLVPKHLQFDFTVPLDTEEAWIPGTQLLMPVSDGHGQPLGLIALDVPVDGMIPSDLRLEMLELFAADVGLVMERSAKVAELRQQIDQVETRIRQAEAEALAAQQFPQLTTLLQKDLEQTLALQQLYRRSRNIRIGLGIAENVNRQPDRQSVLHSVASQMLTEMELDIALVAEPAGTGLQLVGQFGPMPPNANPSALLGQRNPLRETLHSGQMVFVPNLEDSREWRNSPLLKTLGARGFISLPISSNGKVDAALLAISTVPLGDVTLEDEQVYELISSQVSLTLQNLTLLTETRRRLREVNLLLDFSRQLGSLDPNENLNTLVGSVRRVLPHAHGVRVVMWHEEEALLRTEAAAGYNDNERLTEINHRMNTSVIGRVFQKGETLNIAEVDFATDFDLSPDNLLKYREATGGRLPVSMLLIPIKSPDQVEGVIELDNFNTAAAFTAEDQALIESLAQQTALALENARLYAETRRVNEALEQRVAERTQELAEEHQFSQILLKISSELSSSLDLNMVLNRSLEMLCEAAGAEQCNIYISQLGTPSLLFRAGAGIHESPPMDGTASKLTQKEGIAGWLFKQQRPLVIDDLLTDSVWQQKHGLNQVYRSTIATPLIVGQDVLGCLMLFHRQPNHFKHGLADPIQAAANQFAVTINNGELFQLIRDQAEDLGNMLRAQQIEFSRSTAMLEGVGDGVLVTDSQNVITLFNAAAEKMLDLARVQVMGKSLDEFVGLFGGAARAWMDTIRVWSVSPHQPEDAEMYQERLYLEDGRVLSVHLSPVSDRQEFLGTISIFRDITHQVEVDRLKSEFVATVSHELRTPMTPIKGYVEFLLMGGAGELNPQQMEFVNVIKTNIDRLSVLVNDLLDVSRIEAGKVALNMQPIDLHEVVEEVLGVIQQRSEDDQRPVKIVVDIPDDLPSVYGDAERVRQIVTNLVDNACKYSPENSTVTLNLYPVDNSVQIDVIDQGIGIFPDEHDKIFERFYRGENHLVMATAGTGLGLPIVRELVEMHNGKIWVRSTGVPGEGSTFSCTLPQYEDERETIRLEDE